MHVQHVCTLCTCTSPGERSYLTTLKSHVIHQMLLVVVMYVSKIHTRDHKDEMIAVVSAVKQLPDKGEKKVHLKLEIIMGDG